MSLGVVDVLIENVTPGRCGTILDIVYTGKDNMMRRCVVENLFANKVGRY